MRAKTIKTWHLVHKWTSLVCTLFLLMLCITGLPTDFSTTHHYMVAMRGDAPLTARLIQPVLVDAETGALTETRALPWYVATLLISQPLHFGDYGGLPLKIIWAILDIVTIIVLGSGLYLWLARRRSSIEVELAELERAEARLAAE